MYDGAFEETVSHAVRECYDKVATFMHWKLETKNWYKQTSERVVTKIDANMCGLIIQCDQLLINSRNLNVPEWFDRRCRKAQSRSFQR